MTPLPVNFEELLKAVHRRTGASNFSVKLEGHTLSSSRDLIVAYLNSRHERLVFDIEETGSDMSPASAPAYKGQESLHVTNGVLSKQDLLRGLGR